MQQLFHSFLREELEFKKIKEKFDENKKNLAIVRQRFTNMIDDYFQVFCCLLLTFKQILSKALVNTLVLSVRQKGI